VRKSGLSAVIPERLQRTITMVSEAFEIPPADPKALYHPEYLPSHEELALRKP
jgi:hypothetical protein